MEGADRRDPCVLIVEDCPDTALSMLMLLQVWGYSACVASDAESGYQQAILWEPAVILLDISLPRVNGWVLARRLRELEAFRSCLIVAISGFGSEEDHLRSEEAGCDAHLTKPVEMDTLRMFLRLGMEKRLRVVSGPAV